MTRILMILLILIIPSKSCLKKGVNSISYPLSTRFLVIVVQVEEGLHDVQEDQIHADEDFKWVSAMIMSVAEDDNDGAAERIKNWWSSSSSDSWCGWMLMMFYYDDVNVNHDVDDGDVMWGQNEQKQKLLKNSKWIAGEKRGAKPEFNMMMMVMMFMILLFLNIIMMARIVEGRERETRLVSSYSQKALQVEEDCCCSRLLCK